MNLAAILWMPWRSTRVPMRWLIGLFYLACLIAAACVLLFGKTRASVDEAATPVYFGTFYLWAFFVSNSLLMAADAHQLRVPGMTRHIGMSLVIYGGVCVLLPALVLAAVGTPFLAVALAIALAVLGGLFFAWMPQYFALLFGLVPTLLFHQGASTIPGPGRDGFLSWALPALAACLVLVCWRWRVLVCLGDGMEQVRHRPMVVNFKRFDGAWSGGGGLFAASSDNGRVLRRQPSWMAPHADLRGTGPAATRRSLHVMLGGWYLPRTMRGYATSMLCVIPVLLVVAVLALQSEQSQRSWMMLISVMWMPVVVSTAAYGTLLVTMFTVASMSRRWCRPNGELSLLAVLPGLGDVTSVKRQLMRSVLVLPVIVQVILTIIVMASAAYHGASGWVMAAITIAQLGCIGLLPAMLLRVFSGTPLRPWLVGLGCIVFMLIINANCTLPIMSLNSSGSHVIDLIAMVVAIVWLIAGGFMAAIAYKGFHAWRERPHAFMLNPLR